MSSTVSWFHPTTSRVSHTHPDTASTIHTIQYTSRITHQHPHSSTHNNTYFFNLQPTKPTLLLSPHLPKLNCECLFLKFSTTINHWYSCMKPFGFHPTDSTCQPRERTQLNLNLELPRGSGRIEFPLPHLHLLLLLLPPVLPLFRNQPQYQRLMLVTMLNWMKA